MLSPLGVADTAVKFMYFGESLVMIALFYILFYSRVPRAGIQLSTIETARRNIQGRTFQH